MYILIKTFYKVSFKLLLIHILLIKEAKNLIFMSHHNTTGIVSISVEKNILNE